MEAIGRSINDFQSRLLFNRQVNQQWAMIQFTETLQNKRMSDIIPVFELPSYLESHKLVVRLWRPRIYFYRVFERNHEELYSFVFDNFEMNSTL